MSVEIGLQILVAVLLGVTIVYAIMLNRRLSRLRDGNEAMQALAGELGAAATHAEQAVASLRRTAFEDDEALGRRIAEARTARDEIGFLVERAETLATRLETLIADARPHAPAPAAAAARAEAADDDAGLFADDRAAEGDVDAARAARATATAWLRSRAAREPVAANASRGLR